MPLRRTAYKVGSAHFRREAFISYPDQVLIVRITASEAGHLTFTASLDSPQPENQHGEHCGRHAAIERSDVGRMMFGILRALWKLCGWRGTGRGPHAASSSHYPPVWCSFFCPQSPGVTTGCDAGPSSPATHMCFWQHPVKLRWSGHLRTRARWVRSRRFGLEPS